MLLFSWPIRLCWLLAGIRGRTSPPACGMPSPLALSVRLVSANFLDDILHGQGEEGEEEEEEEREGIQEYVAILRSMNE